MLTPSAAWYEAVCRSDADIRFLIAITDGVTTWTCVDAPMDSESDLAGMEVGAQEVAIVGVEVDPVRRLLQMSELFVDFDDPYLRPIVVNNRLEEQTLTVHLGAASLDEADFVDFFSGPIDTITPVSGDDPKVVVTVLSPVAVLEKSITGFWIGKHLLEILYTGDGKGVLEKAGTFSYDASTFDPSDAAYDDIAHLMFSRVTAYGPSVSASIDDIFEGGNIDSAIDEPTPALNIVNGISELLGGNLVFDEAGQVGFARFDPTAASVGSWTDDDIIPGTLVQEPLGQNIINRIWVEFGQSGIDWLPEATKKYVVDDSDSQSAYGVREHKIVTPWINPVVGWLTAPIDDNDVTLGLQGGNLHALSGNRADAWAQVSATLPLYLLLQDATELVANEILKAESLTRDTDAVALLNIYDFDLPGGGVPAEETESFTGCRALIEDITRGALGTTAEAYSMLAFISDITSIVLQADALLARFKYGADVFSVDTPLNKYDVQLGDLILPTLSDYMAYGKDGLDGSVKYEVIQKEVDVYADPPVIHWKLMSATTGATTTLSAAGSRGFHLQDNFTRDSVTQLFADRGHIVTDGGGLDINISSGVITDGKGTQAKPAVAGHTLPASKDVYVKMDGRSRLTIFDAVAIDAAAPTQHAFETLIAKVVTGAAAITSIDNTVRNSQPLQGAKIVENTISAKEVRGDILGGRALNVNSSFGMRE